MMFWNEKQQQDPEDVALFLPLYSQAPQGGEKPQRPRGHD